VFVHGEISEGILVGALPSTTTTTSIATTTTTTTTSIATTTTTTTTTSTGNTESVFEFIAPPDESTLGERIFIDGIIPPKNSSEKLTNHVLKKVKKRITIGNSVVLYNGIPLKTSGGVCCVKNLRSSRIHF